MELMAVIAGLRALKLFCTVTLFSDSKYVVDPMRTGLVHKWKANGWKRNRKEKVLNVDLWEQLLELTARHKVSFDWVRGHADHQLNDRCDRTAVEAANQTNLPADEGYEREHPSISSNTISGRSASGPAERQDEARARKIIAIMDACRDDSNAKTVQYDDSEGFQVYASTSQVAWRYRFRNLDHAYALVQAGAAIRPYRTEV